MSKAKINGLIVIAVIVFVSTACSRLSKLSNEIAVNNNSNTKVAVNKTKIPTASDDDRTASTSGDEKVKPAKGKGNVQGKVLFNDQPAEGIEVKICENFSTFMGIKCDGKTQTTKTDKDGIFVLADLEPQTYEGLSAKVFKTAYYVYPQEGIMTPQKFVVEADKTIFAADINLFKSDVKLISPKAGAKVDAKSVELKWEAYPDAAYYKLSLFPDGGGMPPLNAERVEDSSYAVTENLSNGKYRVKIEAYNSNNHKLAENSDDIKFTVTGGAEPEATK